VLYVDDMLVASKSMVEIKRLKAQLARMFDIKDLGTVKTILGMEIHRERKNGKFWLSQKKYVEKILMGFKMNDMKPIRIPLASHFNISSSLCHSNDEEKEYMSLVPYANAIGSLMYVMVSTRPNISHAFGVVNIYMENPGKKHWETMKWMFWYLRGTSNYCITYNGCNDLVCGYVDSNFVGDLEKSRSTSRYVFTVAGGPVSWMSNIQNIVVLSITEVEYITD
jgi:ATP-binding cassette subfamily B (MDR/TAP) protein 1